MSERDSRVIYLWFHSTTNFEAHFNASNIFGWCRLWTQQSPLVLNADSKAMVEIEIIIKNPLQCIANSEH